MRVSESVAIHAHRKRRGKPKVEGLVFVPVGWCEIERGASKVGCHKKACRVGVVQWLWAEDVGGDGPGDVCLDSMAPQ